MLHALRAWEKKHRRKIVAMSLLLMILFIAAYVWLEILFLFGDDLVIDLGVNQTSFHITNQGMAQADVVLTTQNQFLCAASCSLQLENISTQGVNPLLEFTLDPRQNKTLSLALSPGKRGSGQQIYSITASCHNIKSFLCPSSSPERRKAVLLTVNYDLSSGEEASLFYAKSSIETMLLLLRDSDLVLQENEQLARTRGLHIAELIPVITKTEQSFYAHKLFLETAQQLWREESYTILAELLRSSTTTTPMLMNTTLHDAHAITVSLRDAERVHNQLREAINAARASLSSTFGAYKNISLDENASAAMRDAAFASDAVVDMYVRDEYSDFAVLNSSVEALSLKVGALGSLLRARENALLVSGNKLLTQEKSLLCASNVTCFDFNIPLNATSFEVSITSLCAALPSAQQPTVSFLETMNTSVIAADATFTQLANVSDALRTYSYRFCIGALSVPSLNMSALLPIALPQIIALNLTSDIGLELADNLPQCCVFGSCRACCNTASCNDDPATYPIVFVHGHAFNSGNSPEYSLGGYFASIQRRLQADGYLDAGIITPSSTFSDVAPGEWGLSGRPVTARVTYYYNYYKSGSDYVLIAQKSENIETYAIRLKELIDVVRHHTGKKKVNIVAHSMGGLVVRRYLQLFGEENVDKIILIGTPDYGVTGRTESLCSIVGSNKECSDMAQDSVFLRKLNDPASQPTSVNFTTIAGVGCDTDGKPGDGVVQLDNVRLPYAKNYVINGTCPDFFKTDLHTEMLNINTYPGVYAIIKDTLAAK